MNKVLLIAAIVAVTGCSGSSGSGGTGGGSGGGTSSGGGSGALGGGSSGGGSAGGGSATGGGASNNIAPDQLCAAVLNAECSFGVRCGAFASVAGCEAYLSANGLNCSSTSFASVDAGRATYHGDQAATCLNSLMTAPCAGFAGLSGPGCDSTFVGNVPANGACSYDTDCVPGSFCNTAFDSCGGTCKVKPTAGQRADPNDECAPGTENYGGFCVTPLAQGQSCLPTDGGFEPLPCATESCAFVSFSDGGSAVLCAGLADAGASCVDAAAGISGCAGFASCTATTNICLPPVGMNAACDLNGAPFCQTDLWCNGSLASPACQARSATGGACVNARNCLDGLCDGGTTSNPDGGDRWILGVCVPYPGSGQPCDPVCDTGFYCDSQTHTCLHTEPDGQPCQGPDQCSSGACSSRDGGPGACGFCE